MRSTTHLTGALAVLATTGLLGLGGAAHATASDTARTGDPSTTHERGIVVECTGGIRGRHVYTSVYENNRYGNEIQLLLGTGDHRVGGSRTDDDGFRHGHRVRAAIRVAGHRAVVTGTARQVGDRIPVSEEHDDAGQHITVTGFHHSLDTDLTLTWRGAAAPLTCATAFAYRLTVTRESTVG